MEGVYRNNRSLNTNNFGGTFTFSSPEAFRAGRPANYRVSRGEPLLEKDQLELSFFMQNDLKLTPRLTLMYGLRYDVQTNLSDRNNFGPRLGFAYAIRPGTVIRGGGGLFFNTYIIGLVELQERLRHAQYEIVIDNPSS
jgi:outer membrane receptor protein involved in Fe transport